MARKAIITSSSWYNHIVCVFTPLYTTHKGILKGHPPPQATDGKYDSDEIFHIRAHVILKSWKQFVFTKNNNRLLCFPANWCINAQLRLVNAVCSGSWYFQMLNGICKLQQKQHFYTLFWLGYKCQLWSGWCLQSCPHHPTYAVLCSGTAKRWFLCSIRFLQPQPVTWRLKQKVPNQLWNLWWKNADIRSAPP